MPKPKKKQSNDNMVIVIGAGIVGVSAALWLQRYGYSVILLDRKGVASGTSYGNGGILSACSVIPVAVPGIISKIPAMLWGRDGPLFMRWRYLPRFLPWGLRNLAHATTSHIRYAAQALTTLIHDSLDQHRALSAGTAAEVWLHPSEYLYVYGSPTQRDADAKMWQLRKEMGFDFRYLDGKELTPFLSQANENFPSAVCLSDHGYISDPGRYIQDLARHFVARGGKVIIDEAKDFTIKDNKLKAVLTSKRRLPCSQVILASGAWSGPLIKRLGIRVPLESERGYHIDLVAPSIMPTAPLMIAASKCVITPMDGRLRCAGLVEFAGLDHPPSQAPFDLLLRTVMKVFPSMSYERVHKWMGHRPSLPDSLPIIGRHPEIPNVFLGFGHHHIGLTGGPKTGRWLADIIDGRTPNYDQAPFSVSRFQGLFNS